jgi:hypothetical protein
VRRDFANSSTAFGSLENARTAAIPSPASRARNILIPSRSHFYFFSFRPWARPRNLCVCGGRRPTPGIHYGNAPPLRPRTDFPERSECGSVHIGIIADSALRTDSSLPHRHLRAPQNRNNWGLARAARPRENTTRPGETSHRRSGNGQVSRAT